ncbi:MAG: hypothetical protein CMO82_05660 [Winogradskyella sp.]|nr:hypothetical protein [Winogradskyella sp.]|tara:strand:- start:7099 stop:7986 length:888 start_codon:yes stop_codon:yes gene_type:complete
MLKILFMKHLYFFLGLFFINYFGFAQYHQFQLVLVDSNVGSEVYLGCAGCSQESNDEGLNNIFQNHNVTCYQTAYVYSDTPNDLYGSIHIGGCDGCNIAQLVQDLNNYDSVIMIASEDYEEYSFNHGLNLTLVDDTIGTPIGENNGVVTTNNTNLNQIFTNFNVSYYTIANAGTSYENYELFCNCDATLLKQELDMLSTIVLSTDYMSMGVVLSTEESQMTHVSIHPNPFKDKISIKINKAIESIEIYDILGKSIYKSSSVSELENYSSTLKSGVYLLKITTKDGNTMTKKLIKS